MPINLGTRGRALENSSTPGDRLTSNPVANGVHPGATQEPPDGAWFTIAHPNEPPRVNQISATELKAMMDRGLPFELVDVRTEEERAIAKIEGSRLLNEEGHDYLLSLDRNTTILFHCHHGIRSQSAAEYFLREKGFRNLYNLRGGIDAWSQLVDPSVPRY